MDAEQLWETTLNPEKNRVLKRVEIEMPGWRRRSPEMLMKRRAAETAVCLRRG